MFTEAIEFVSMLVIMWSATQKTELRFRIINSLGCLLSITYGLLSHTYAPLVIDTLILIINIHRIIKLKK